MAKKREPRKTETAEEILAKAAQRKPDPEKFARVQERADAAIQSDRFEFSRSKSCVDGLLIHYFRTVGESVTGVLAAPESELWKGVTYKLVQDDGVVVRLPGNRRLNKAIKTADCLYQRVTITYLGKLYTRFGGHYEKVYTVVPAPLVDPRQSMSSSAAKLFAAAADKKKRKAEAKD
jgi:hypothetical protein